MNPVAAQPAFLAAFTEARNRKFYDGLATEKIDGSSETLIEVKVKAGAQQFPDILSYSRRMR